MKKLLIFLALILVISQAFGQRKSKEDPKDAKIDSLTTYSKSLSLQLDSVNKELVKYVGLYNTIKDNVIHYNFDPTRSAYLIDSLKASRDSTASLLVGPKSTGTIRQSGGSDQREYCPEGCGRQHQNSLGNRKGRHLTGGHPKGKSCKQPEATKGTLRC